MSIVVTMITIYTNYLGGTSYLFCGLCLCAYKGEALQRPSSLWLRESLFTETGLGIETLLTGRRGFGSLHPWPSAQHCGHCFSALFFLRGIRRAAPAQVAACKVVTLIMLRKN